MIDDPELPSTGLSTVSESQSRWRVWAPKADRVELVLGLGDEAQRLTMEPIGLGFFECMTAHIEPGVRYAYRLDGGPPLPDPCSRSQPDGVNAASEVWFPERFRWNDDAWRGVERSRLVVYELHVGTFTPEGTFEALIPRVEELLDLGITAIELMPVGQFSGTRGWGYDGVFPFAPQNSYGGPEALQRLVDACHRRGMAVFLDVIYNHFGPEGNVFPLFGDYLTDTYKTAWGPALNFDGRGSDAVRAMVLENARQWIRDYHIDGLRLDAADQIFDRSPRNILSEIAEVVHVEAARVGRCAHVFAETDLNDAPRFLHPVDRGGYQLDGQWNDDFHHAAHVVLTGETNGYYADFADSPAALAKAYERLFVNDGNYSPFRGRRHGTKATEFSGDRFLAFTQNHDQVGNRLKSDRYASMLAPSAVRLAAGILLLAPRLPLIFMGEEYGETRPFPFFCDFQDPGLIEMIREGRKAEFSYFGWEAEILDPFATSTRDSAVLSWFWESGQRLGLRLLYRDLLRLRRELPTLADFSPARTRLIGDDAANSVLSVRRGGSHQELRIALNLSPNVQQLTEDWQNKPPFFRSEIERYGGPGCESASWHGHLQPHEFVILEPS
ncbi:malto-oligosyltrehalose trehalohydrolase [Singulisphaera acidiphila]|uniref:Malto-oligosyltrehalose trehalohydrolase n=1 Tax=Singulisphaera acidiphila (strain ATCC BAA-1392 / DSM 18658 / VKM B-2454 / MOB10) TaxID=886293 RepID=L0DMD2_SINAD|nr:malto-oligosyltrehalose trehalohydrolase [Singulisphaera acidiphila]AGA29975.1 malto-oligosyltrehalose trehalohydrolase [Singulisphaera acidiphila DSM 18658]